MSYTSMEPVTRCRHLAAKQIPQTDQICIESGLRSKRIRKGNYNINFFVEENIVLDINRKSLTIVIKPIISILFYNNV